MQEVCGTWQFARIWGTLRGVGDGWGVGFGSGGVDGSGERV